MYKFSGSLNWFSDFGITIIFIPEFDHFQRVLLGHWIPLTAAQQQQLEHRHVH